MARRTICVSGGKRQDYPKQYALKSVKLILIVHPANLRSSMFSFTDSALSFHNIRTKLLYDGARYENEIFKLHYNNKIKYNLNKDETFKIQLSKIK